MNSRIPEFKTDTEAETFLDQDLSDLDFSQFKPVQFEFAPKTERVNMRLPKDLLDAVKASASREGLPYQRFIRRVLEHAVSQPQENKPEP
ncbi:Predicted DNA binding protein, CopG/RHH family [Methylobacterium sp. 174MFSha1.1]|uniref:CopG family antitoxin n=1 Tax=Methylobacterium sp. 174MFSha1.1 TaxID=1502749 RepID=UPI0008E922E6|nr:CopG family antitoxin [Methylobacterium sp. 174MFSha1.1]SFU54869.1 Predicted DNA binding protein, CopG/RHH family [Methylobacterium sp. 174MFSha1.1]